MSQASRASRSRSSPRVRILLGHVCLLIWRAEQRSWKTKDPARYDKISLWTNDRAEEILSVGQARKGDTGQIEVVAKAVRKKRKKTEEHASEGGEQQAERKRQRTVDKPSKGKGKAREHKSRAVISSSEGESEDGKRRHGARRRRGQIGGGEYLDVVFDADSESEESPDGTLFAAVGFSVLKGQQNPR